MADLVAEGLNNNQVAARMYISTHSVAHHLRQAFRIRVIDVDPGQAVLGAGLDADGCTGRARMLVDEDHGYLLGVTFVGPGGGRADPLGHHCPWSARSRSAGSAAPSLASPPSAKSGFASSRPTGPEPGTRHSSLPRRSRMFIPNGPWCLPPVNRYATQGSLRACVRLSQLDDVNAL